MSSPDYPGRHRKYEARHRTSRRAPGGLRVPRTLNAGYLMPTAAATTLVITATGATFVGDSTIKLDLSGAQAEAARAEAAEAAALAASVTDRRQQAQAQAMVLQGRQQEQVRVARDAQRRALAAKAKEEAARAAALAKAQRWMLPLEGAPMTSGYGWRWGRLHAGIDFAASIGTPLRAMSSGRVVYAGWMSGYGNKVEIQYWDGTVSYYGHMNSISVYVGQEVSPGQVVGETGNTGRSTGPHLHLEIHPSGGEAVDPYGWLVDHGIRP